MVGSYGRVPPVKSTTAFAVLLPGRVHMPRFAGKRAIYGGVLREARLPETTSLMEK
jgi:hypothetical protein